MSDAEWLASLKPGDKVARWYGFGGVSIVEVNRVTGSHLIIGSSKFRKKDGCLVGGDSWNRTSIGQVTEKAETEALRSKVFSLFRDQPVERIKKMRRDQLEKLNSLLTEIEAELNAAKEQG